MKNVVVIDDVRNFSFDATVLRTQTQALEYLKEALHAQQYIDELWLDHDLGGNDTIRPVVDELEHWWYRGTPLKIGVIVIHSANPVGRRYIEMAINKLGADIVCVNASDYVIT